MLDFRTVRRAEKAVQADGLARRGVSDKNGAHHDNILYLCIPRLITKHPARLRRGFPAYPDPLLRTTTLRLVLTVYTCRNSSRILGGSECSALWVAQAAAP